MNLIDQLEDFPARASDIARVALGKKPTVAQPMAGGGDQPLPAIEKVPQQQPTNEGENRAQFPEVMVDKGEGQSSLGGQNTLSEGAQTGDGVADKDGYATSKVHGDEASCRAGAGDLGGTPHRSNVRTAPELASMLDQVSAFFRRYVIFPIPEQYDLISLWVAHTYVYDVFHWSPYLIIRSPEAECGKTTVLSILELLVRAPWRVIVPTPAVIYRKVEAHRPTILIDEFDTIYNEKIKSEANETLRGTLNAGFERGVIIPRCDGPKNDLLEFSPYCPKALAGIGRLPETVESRAFIIPIVRLGNHENVEEYDEEIAPEEASHIAASLKQWAAGSRTALKASSPSRPAELKPRQRNIAKPLLAIADLAGDEWPERARDALVKVCAKEKLISQGQQLLADVRKIMLAGSMDKITTDMLLEYLVRVENANAPWPVMWENDLRLGKIRGPAKKLASLLKHFDIHPHTIRFGADVKNGYMRIDFLEAWDRYLEPPKAETAELDLDI